MPARGFGKTPPKATPTAIGLSAEAADVLSGAGGNIDAAHERYYARSLQKIEADTGSGAVSHATRVRATWDTIAAFQPHTTGGSPNAVVPAVARRLKKIARECVPKGSPADGGVLDVGCGSGLLLPSLVEAGLAPAAYLGIDVSGGMVELAAEVNAGAVAAGARFERTGFAELCARGPAARYRSVVWNGALQFFAADEVPAVLADATSLALAPERGARLVVSHANGAAFVRDEARGSPATVLSVLPTVREWVELAAPLGLELSVHGERVEAGADLEALEARNEASYLVALERV